MDPQGAYRFGNYWVNIDTKFFTRILWDLESVYFYAYQPLYRIGYLLPWAAKINLYRLVDSVRRHFLNLKF